MNTHIQPGTSSRRNHRGTTNHRNKRGTTNHRSNRGTTICEFGPALFILLFAFFFPLLNLVSLGFTYGLCHQLNRVQVREAALMKPNNATQSANAVFTDIPRLWYQAGIGRFCNLTQMPKTSVDVSHPAGMGGNRKTVTVKTDFQCRPFLNIPVPISVPAMNRPFAFSIISSRIVEYAS